MRCTGQTRSTRDYSRTKNNRLEKRVEFFLSNSFSEGVTNHEIISFYSEDQKRKGKLFLKWTKDFFKFLQESYGMTLPWEKIIIVPVDAE